VSDTALCEQCRGPIEVSDRFCPSCGSVQTQATVEQTPSAPAAAPEQPDAIPGAQPDSSGAPRAQAHGEAGGAPPPPPTAAASAQAAWTQRTSVHLERFSREEQIFAGVCLLFAIDLLFLPWFEVSLGGFSISTSATQNPDGWLGVLALLAALATIADLAIERLSPHVHLPSLGRGRAATRFVLASIAAGCVALKFLFHIHFSLFGAGFWLAVVLAVALVMLAARLRQAPATVGAS
jgi:hypothetical protein